MTNGKHSRPFLLAGSLLTGPAVAFAAGIALVGRDVQGPAIALFILGPLALAVWVGFAVAMALGAHRGRAASTLLGAAFTSLTFMAVDLGAFVPYIAGWSGHDLDLYGQEFGGWRQWLRTELIVSGFLGALVGGAVGFLVWVFRPARTRPV